MDLYSSYEQELAELAAHGLARRLYTQETEGRINLSSNDYLGLSQHSLVKEAALRALRDHGVGGGSSRLLAGTRAPHIQLEDQLAAFFLKDRALVFSSGYQANTGVIPVLVGTPDAVFVDRLCHASIFDGIKMSGARLFPFDHNNAADLEALLRARRPTCRRALVVTEGIFSMDGDASPLTDLVPLAKEHDALFYLDEAHSIGVFGPDGRGWAAERNVLPDIDVFVGTLSKSLGSQGGFVAARTSVIDLLISRSRSFIYTTALAPVCAAAASAALSLLPALEKERQKILNASRHMRAALLNMGYFCFTSASQIVPVRTGDVEKTKKLSDHLLRRGFFVPSIRPPTVPKGQGRVRLSISLNAVIHGIDQVLEGFSTYPMELRKAEEKIVQIG